MDEVVALNFTPQTATMTAHDFMQQVLKEQLHVAVLVIGYDHRFGRGRTEGFDDYVRYGQEMGIEVVRGEACVDEGEPISSTRIRHLINEGKMDEATPLLGHRYTLYGEVVDGYKEGRKIGFPTANIRPTCANKLIPADGVYAVYVNTIDSENEYRPSEWKSSSPFLGMLNIGYRPTLNNGRERSIEAHILDFEGNLYGKSIKVEFVHRLRDERTFDSLGELTEQLRKDKEKVRELLTGKE
jgi:riboflavin kinase/FMN adenylyltransferase